LEGVPVDVIPLKLKPNEKWRRALQKTSVDGGKLVASLQQIKVPGTADTDKSKDSKDDKAAKPQEAAGPQPNTLLADDTAWAILTPRKVQRVLLVTEGNVFLQKVFEANPLVQCEVSKTLPEKWPANTIVFLHRQVPEKLPPGDVFVIEPATSCDTWDIGEVIENPIVTQQDTTSPLMTHVRLDNVLMPEAKRLTFTGESQVLAGTLSGDPVYTILKRDGGKCLVLSVDLDRSDLAFRTAFPIMVTNALGWFHGDAGEMQSALATGQLAQFTPDKEKFDTKSKLALRSPAGREVNVAWHDTDPATPTAKDKTADKSATDSKAKQATNLPLESTEKTAEISVGPFDECGVWSVVAKTGPEKSTTLREFPVNLANERESDLRPREEVSPDSASVQLAGAWFSRPMWFYFVFCACAISVAEWFMYQRRVIS
jgi:hypothetical protein